MKRILKKIGASLERAFQRLLICSTLVLIAAALVACVANWSMRSAAEAHAHAGQVAAAKVAMVTKKIPVRFASAQASLPLVEPRIEQLIRYVALPAADIPINRKAQKCLGSLIHTEAGDQSKLGKLAVGFTVPNRAKLNRKDFGGNTICGVANYTTKSKRYGLRRQYDGMKHPPKLLTEATIEDMDIAADILRGRVKPEGWLKKALFYKQPKFAKGPGGKYFDELIPIGTIGVHHFYDEKLTLAQKSVQ